MNVSDLDALIKAVPVHAGQGSIYVLDEEMPPEHAEAFWIFTGPQGVHVLPNGKYAIPVTAWDEYLQWLSEAPEASPETVTNDTKYAWRRMRG